MRARKVLATGWTILILIACSLPGNQLPAVPAVHLDKAVHFLLFFLFGWLWMRCGPITHRRMGIVLAAGLAYGILTEVYQGILPWHRTADPGDAIANTLGLLAGVLVPNRGNNMTDQGAGAKESYSD